MLQVAGWALPRQRTGRGELPGVGWYVFARHSRPGFYSLFIKRLKTGAINGGSVTLEASVDG